MREKCFGGEHSRATGRVLIAKRLRREGLLLHSPQTFQLRTIAALPEPAGVRRMVYCRAVRLTELNFAAG
jgi:hypothetical protein